MKSKLSQLKELLGKLKPSPRANAIAANSTIKFIPQRGYLVFTGDIEPYFEGSFEEVKEMIENHIEEED